MTDRANLIEELREWANAWGVANSQLVDGLRRAAVQIEADGRLEAELARLRAILTEIAGLKAEDMHRADGDNTAAVLARDGLQGGAA